MNETVNAVILAAGLGTRMKSKRAKVLHRAGGLSLVEHVINAAGAITSPDHMTVVVGHQAEQVQALLTPRGVRFALQAEQGGTGHAVMMCREALERDPGLVVVLYGDCPLLSRETLQRLVRMQAGSSSGATLITTQLEDPTGYGRIVLDEAGNVQAIVEQKAGTPEQLAIRLVNPGIYCFRADLLWKHIGEIRPDNPAHEYYLTDMVEILTRAGHRVRPLEVADPNELLGINSRVELAMVDRIFRERKARELMLDGVTIEKPETVSVDAPVRIGQDSILEPGVRITGHTTIGEECRIGTGAIIENSQLGRGVVVGAYTVISDSTLGDGVHAGPFARLRMHNVVGEGAHIGNFVELKKTRFGKGSKANHLAYLGDATIGAGVNIGAGTITCNYDGRNKHPTQIGDGAFVGSNSTLVAPVEVGAGSYIGAGSVVTEPVPGDSLALGRSRQVVKEGWAAKRRGNGVAD